MAHLLFVGTSEHVTALSEELRGSHTVLTSALDGAIEAYLADRADLVLVDVAEEGGFETLRALRLEDPAATVIALSANGTVEEAVRAGQDGAVDYLALPMDRARFDLLLDQHLVEKRTSAQLHYLRSRDARGTALSELVGQCRQMQRVFETVMRLVRRTTSGTAPTILLRGETGTGKGCIARAIHYNGRRRDGPFVEVSCASIPETLLEGELFGHEQGAYTDARTPRVGLIETAAGGTLFLDEVSCLPTSAQAKLLTFLEEKMIRRLGSSVDRILDVQVIAATNRDLAYMAEQDEFRVDLLHRLMVVTLNLPPLRERGEDAVELATFFLGDIARQYGQPIKHLSPAACQAIRRYKWPGNVRELRNVIERVVLLEDDTRVQPQHLKLDKKRTSKTTGLEIRLPPQGVALEEIERRVLEQALEACAGNISQAARFLGISRPTLRYRLKKLDLHPRRED